MVAVTNGSDIIFQNSAGSTGVSDAEFKWTCLNAEGVKRNTYLISVSYKTNSSGFTEGGYKCINLDFIGDTMIHLEESNMWAIGGDPDRCKLLELRSDPWIMLKRHNLSPQACPLSGGFNIRFFKDNKEYCPNVYNPARLESHCDTGEGMVFDFQDCPHQYLVPNMKDRESLQCYLDWHHAKWRYIVLSTNGHQGFWLFRIPHNFEYLSSFRADLLSDMVYDTSDIIQHTSHYVTMQLNNVVFDTLCADASSKCSESSRSEVCASDNMFGHIFCKKTCGVCPEHYDTSPCTFPESLFFAWRPLPRKPNRYNQLGTSTLFSVAQNYVEFGQLGELNCVLQKSYSGYTRYALAYIQNNGCVPRFQCLLIDTLQHGSNNHTYGTDINSVIAYKIEQGAKWPDFEETFYCNPRILLVSPSETFWNFAVPGTRQLKPAVCDFQHTSFSFQEHSATENGHTCAGSLNKMYCNPDSTRFTLTSSTCTEPRFEKSTTYTCFASFHSNNGLHTNKHSAKIIILQVDSHQGGLYMCLVIQTHPEPALLLDSKECLLYYFYENHPYKGRTLDLTESECVVNRPEVAKLVPTNAANHRLTIFMTLWIVIFIPVTVLTLFD